MRKNQNDKNTSNKAKSVNITNSFKLISSCIRTVSSNVRSAGASIAGSIAGDSDDPHKDQVLWACFDRLELGPSLVKRVLLLGFSNGFRVLDVEDGYNVSQLVSRHDNAITFLQMQPIPAKSDGHEGFWASHPLLLVVASEETRSSGPTRSGRAGPLRDNYDEPQLGTHIHLPTAVRFYSLRSNSYVHVLRFRSAVYMVRCSPKIVAVGLASQIYCFDALTLENKFSVLTYPVPQLGSQGCNGVNIGYGPMAVGPRWLAYASNNPVMSNTGRLSPQSLSPSPGVSPSTSPGNGNLVARYAMESSKQLASGLLNLGDMGYKTLSKYCQELLPDGSSSPVSQNSSWKVGRVAPHASETDAAGTVVIKDFMTRAVVSEFRAHTSPISALCFDPSGTLLVTASIHGHNINIFRIMPPGSQTGSGTHNYSSRSSHVHLYKLHRGFTSAVIQDICFSPYSQWIAIVSSRRTGHVYVLCPFGGETGLQMQNSHPNGPTLLPVLSEPWWSTSSFTINQPSPAPPPPVTLSVVSRIKSSGWLDTVSNATSSAAGKLWVPSGAVAAVFHNPSVNLQPSPSNVNALENLTVFTPSGYVVQYELLPSLVGDQGESSIRNGTNSVGQGQEELRVKVGPVNKWNICQRTDWAEVEESICGNTLCKNDVGVATLDPSACEDEGKMGKEMVKPYDQSRLYLSNAEVQMRSGRVPVWQKSMICFYAMSPLAFEGENLSNGGEIEIEKIPAHEIEIRQKDLLPVVDRFQRILSEWGDGRGHGLGRYSSSSSLSDGGSKEKFSEGALSKAELVTPGSVENSHTGSPRSPTVTPVKERMDAMKYCPPFAANVKETPEVSTKIVSSLEEDYVIHYSRSAKQVPPPSNCEGSNTSSNRSDSSTNFLEEELVHEEDMHDQYFQGGYYKAESHGERHDLTEVVTDDIDSSTSPCNKAKSEEEDGDSDDMLGGVFDFSEEG